MPSGSTFITSASMERQNTLPHCEDDRSIIWFDIDNTLYSGSASIKVTEAMRERGEAYFASLGFQRDEANKLRRQYRSQYGLVLRGLIRHHAIDTIEYDQRCDGSLPLEDLLKPDDNLRQLLKAIDRSKFRVWGLTNAYVTHATRVLKVLNLHDLFEGIVYCDYAEPDFTCKPEPSFYHAALSRVRINDHSKCYFVDDSKDNIVAAKKLGWGNCVHFCEPHFQSSSGDEKSAATDYHTISSLDDLRHVWPEIFLPSPDGKLGSSLL